MFKVNNGNNGKRCKIYSKLTIKITERRPWHSSGVFIIKGELRNFKKLLTYFWWDNIWQENSLVYHKTCFPRKTWVLFMLLQRYFKRSRIIWVDPVEYWNWRHCSRWNFVEKYLRLKWKKREVNVIITIIIEYAWICLNVPI